MTKYDRELQMAGLVFLLELTRKDVGNENLKQLFTLYQLPELVANVANRFIYDTQIRDISDLLLTVIGVDTRGIWLEPITDNGKREKQDWWKRRYTPVDIPTPKLVADLGKAYYEGPKH